MKKIFKTFMYSLLVLIPVGFIIGFSTAWTGLVTINAAGSSSVQPLMTLLGNDYTAADVVVQAGGSSEGIKAAATLQKDLGNASKNPYSSVEEANLTKNGYDKSDWENNGLKTVTIAWDAIAIVYKPATNDTGTFTINSSNIATLYSAFSGLTTQTLGDFGVTNADGSLSTTTLLPYARTGGASASGTATSFLEQSGFDNWINTITNGDNVKSILKSGQYQGSVRTTSESNVESWNMMSNENRTGSIIYLSLGFVSNNLEAIQNAGYRVAYYQGDNSTEVVEATTTNVGKGTYGWYSPLNTMISTTNANDATKDFVWWIINSTAAQTIISDNGYVSLTGEQKSYMTYDHNNRPADYMTTYATLGSDDALNNIDMKNQFFSMTDYSLTYNATNHHYFGTPKLTTGYEW